MIPLLIAYILNIIDYIFTAYWVREFGIEIESNPFGQWLFEHNIAWVFKIFIAGGLFALLGYVIKQYPKAVIAAYILIAIFGLIVIYHIIIAVRIYIF